MIFVFNNPQILVWATTRLIYLLALITDKIIFMFIRFRFGNDRRFTDGFQVFCSITSAKTLVSLIIFEILQDSSG